MTPSADLAAPLRIVFRAPAGPRRGFGHLVRCVQLSRALGVRPLVALRGTRRAVDAALVIGADLLAAPSIRTLAALRPDIVVIDDPVAADARRWIRAARRAGAAVVTIHDLGLGCTEGDLVIDGSATRQARPSRGRALVGPRFAVLDPALARRRATPVLRGARPKTPRVLIALGGGPHARVAARIAEAIVEGDPRAEVRIAAGFVHGTVRAASPARVEWVAPRRGLAPELAQATVAVVGGGVSLYEACAAGVPAVSVPVVTSQVPTARAFARRGAAVTLPFPAVPRRAASEVVALLRDSSKQSALVRRSTRLVDGRGALRAAAAVVALAR
jgi:spore coat polysaccharide biosynthesis predicted glycosyltransferase SpsG